MQVHETSAEEERAVAGAINRMWRRTRVATAPVPALEYAPPAHRAENVTQIPVKDVEVITGEIDEVLKAAKDEIAELERQTLIVRNLYVEHTKRISAHIKRLRAGVKLSMDTMAALRDQCRALDAAEAEAPVPELEAGIAKIAETFGAGHETDAG